MSEPSTNSLSTIDYYETLSLTDQLLSLRENNEERGMLASEIKATLEANGEWIKEHASLAVRSLRFLRSSEHQETLDLLITAVAKNAGLILGNDSTKKDLNGQLLREIRIGKMDTLEKLIDQGVDPNQLAWRPILLKILQQKNVPLAIKILKGGVDPKSPLRSIGNMNTAHHATSHGLFEVLHYLDTQQYDFTLTDNQGQNCLHIAALEGHADIVSFLCERGLNPSQIDGSGRNALHHATLSHQDSNDLANTLIKMEIDPTQKDFYGDHALHNTLLMQKLVLSEKIYPFFSSTDLLAVCGQGKNCLELAWKGGYKLLSQQFETQVLSDSGVTQDPEIFARILKGAVQYKGSELIFNKFKEFIEGDFADIYLAECIKSSITVKYLIKKHPEHLRTYIKNSEIDINSLSQQIQFALLPLLLPNQICATMGNFSDDYLENLRLKRIYLPQEGSYEAHELLEELVINYENLIEGNPQFFHDYFKYIPLQSLAALAEEDSVRRLLPTFNSDQLSVIIPNMSENIFTEAMLNISQETLPTYLVFATSNQKKELLKEWNPPPIPEGVQAWLATDYTKLREKSDHLIEALNHDQVGDPERELFNDLYESFGMRYIELKQTAKLYKMILDKFKASFSKNDEENEELLLSVREKFDPIFHQIVLVTQQLEEIHSCIFKTLDQQKLLIIKAEEPPLDPITLLEMKSPVMIPGGDILDLTTLEQCGMESPFSRKRVRNEDCVRVPSKSVKRIRDRNFSSTEFGNDWNPDRVRKILQDLELVPCSDDESQTASSE